MLNVRLDPAMEARLTAIAKRTARTKSQYVRAVLAEHIEDLELYARAEEALRDYDPAKNIPLEQMKRELGLDG